MVKLATTDLDFDCWSSFAQHDPEAFERLRCEAIDELIESAPEHMQQRLRGLQWQIDQVRRQSKTPMDACRRLSDMMWDRLVGEGGLLEALNTLLDIDSEPREPKSLAEVVSLHGHRLEREPDV